MATYSCTGAHYRRNGGSWWSPLAGGITPTGWNADGSNKYETRLLFDFNSIRAMNVDNYISSARFYFHQTNQYNVDPVFLRITNSSYSTIAGGLSVNSVVNGWAYIQLNQAMIDALVNANAYYCGTYGSSNGTYIEIYATASYIPYLDITWTTRNTAPNPPSSITITDTGFGEGSNIGGVTSVTVSCGTATDAQDGTAPYYQLEYSVNGGSWTILSAYSATRTKTLSLTSITAGLLIQFRAFSKDSDGVPSSTAVYTSNRAYKIPAPSTPASIVTPGTITTNSMSLSWGASPDYDTSVGVRYTVELYDTRTSSWISAVSAYNGLSTTANPYTVLSLDEVNQQYYYSTGALIRVKAIFATAVQGQTLSSSYRTSSSFTIDYRLTPAITSFSVNYTGTDNAYEGEEYTVSITKGSVEGNKKDHSGNAMQYHYKIDILYGTGYSSVYVASTTSNVVWGSLPATVNIIIPSIASTGDISSKIRVTIINIENLSSYPTDSEFTTKKYRSPSAQVDSFDRSSETEFSVTFSISDTGINSQLPSAISSITALFGAVSKPFVLGGSLTGLTVTFDASDGITAASKGTVSITIENEPEDSMTSKSIILYQTIPQFLPNMRLTDEGLFVKGNYYTWDNEGVATNIDDKYLHISGGTLTGDLTLPRIRLTSIEDVSLASTLHAFQIGLDNAYNLAIDNNEIQARNNGAAATLYLNAAGGLVDIGAGGLNVGDNPVPTVVKDGTAYYRVKFPSDSDGYMRTPSSGIIPYTSGTGTVGTSGWPFDAIYGDAIYQGGDLVWDTGDFTPDYNKGYTRGTTTLSGTDANAWTECGTTTYGSTYTNFFSASARYGIIDIIGRTTSHKWQRCWDTTNTVWIRCTTNGGTSWSAWAQL